MYAKVAVGGKSRLLLHYEIPAELEGQLAPGHLVRVPLRRDKRPGVVVALSDTSPVPNTRPVLELVDPVPAVPGEYLALARWMSEFYQAPLADCVWLVARPPRVGARRVRSVERLASPAQVEAARPALGRPVKQADILDWLAASVDPLPTAEEVCGAVDCSEGPLRALDERGWVEVEREDRLKTVLLLLSPQEARARAEELRGSEIYYAVLDLLAAEGNAAPAAQVRAATGCELYHLRRLEELGLLVLSEREVVRDPLSDVEYVPVEPPPLTPDQQAAWEQIRPSLACGGPSRVYLLHGVTGSGKTEIYLRAVEAVLAQGRRAMVLVPEISLTPQTSRRFLARFPGRVGLYHSQLSGGERYETWERARNGQLDVLIGPRSALFAPLPDLGLIVLDEEHDTSFKADARAPAYHAREVALELAQRREATLLLGSATPSLESYRRAQTGKFQLLALPQRIRGHARRLEAQQAHFHVTGKYRQEVGDARYIPLPPVQVVDMRQELRAGNRHIFSRALQTQLRETLARGEQVILFLNRRGHATFVLCRDCGHVLECPNCEVPLTQHKSRRGRGGYASRLVCHHCDYRRAVPQHCPDCHSQRIRYFGLGTQRVEAMTRDLYPGARLLRWDRDTVQRRGAHELIMSRFASGQADVLIGTQMVAKGLDLPLVTLVGVISADTALNLPDFRAGERTFQLLTQVAGRAGRGLLGGRVVVQTYNPEHYAVQAASHHDYAAFAQRELAFRRESGYPPYRRLARLEYRDRKARRAQLQAENLAETLRAALMGRGLPPEDVIGPAPAFFAKVRGQYRWHILLRADDPVALLRPVEIPAGWQVDIDPVSLL
jgi:primosomal protein N' (replication factor Y)